MNIEITFNTLLLIKQGTYVKLSDKSCLYKN